MRRKKLYSELEKNAIIEEFMSTDSSLNELSKKYEVNRHTIFFWVKQKRELMDVNNQKSVSSQELSTEVSAEKRALLDEIKRLKKELEKAKLETEFYQQIIKVAEEDLGLSIKKKPNIKP